MVELLFYSRPDEKSLPYGQHVKTNEFYVGEWILMIFMKKIQDFWRESLDATRVFYPEVIQQGKPGAFDAVQILLELGAEQAPGIACGSLVPTQDALDKLPQGVESALRQCRLLAGRIWTMKRGGAGAVKIEQ